MSDQDAHDFYIGYYPKAPASYRRPIAIGITVIGILVILVALILATTQRKFSDNRFEFGTLTEIQGTLVVDPVPRLVIGPAESQKSILLVGFGKCGAEETIETIENARGILLDGREVTLRGTLIYGEGKTLMELTEGPESLMATGSDPKPVEASRSLGVSQVHGKIIDPKCYFGVMKPGEGKTHRACAVRCISGGIPPVLRTLDGQFILLTHATFNLNHMILPYVDDFVSVQGDLRESTDWQILEADLTTLERHSAPTID